MTVIEGIDEGDDDEDDDTVRDLSSFDGMIADALDDEEVDPTMLPLPEEVVDDDAPYDPLPGFESM